MAGLLELLDNLASKILLFVLGAVQHQLKDSGILFNFLCLGFFVGLGQCYLVWLVILLVYFYILQRRKINLSGVSVCQSSWCAPAL